MKHTTPTPTPTQSLHSKASIWVGNNLVWIVLIFGIAGVFIALNPEMNPWK